MSFICIFSSNFVYVGKFAAFNIFAFFPFILFLKASMTFGLDLLLRDFDSLCFLDDSSDVGFLFASIGIDLS